MWNVLKTIKKFIPKSELDKIIGAPLFQLEDRPVYYYGGGITVYYSPMCFRIEGIQRVGYGVLGEYAVGLYQLTSKIFRSGNNIFLVSSSADIIISYLEVTNTIIRYLSLFSLKCKANAIISPRASFCSTILK